MKLPQDFREFLELFNSRSIEYMVVGSYALAYFGGRNDYIVNKRAVGRAKDLADIEALGD